MLFPPRIVGKEASGIRGATFHSVAKRSMDVREGLRAMVDLSGGIVPRRSARPWPPSRTKVKVVATPEHKHSVWIGGSALSSLSALWQLWTSEGEYEEPGPTIVRRKCF